MKRPLVSAFVLVVAMTFVLGLARGGARASPDTLYVSTPDNAQGTTVRTPPRHTRPSSPAISQAGDGDTTLIAVEDTNLLVNASFEEDGRIPAPWKGKNLTLKDRRVCNTAHDGSCSFRMLGTTAKKSLRQVVRTSGSAGDFFILSGWSKARTPLSKGGAYCLEAKVFHSDGTKKGYKTCFTKRTHGWQYREKTFTVAKKYNKIVVYLRYYKQGGKALFDDVWLVKRYCPDGWKDDFSDPNSGWHTMDMKGLKLEYLAGEFHVLIKKPHWGAYFGTWPYIYATNFTLEVDGRSGLGTYGLEFGKRVEWDDDYNIIYESYSFEIGPGRWWAIYKNKWGGQDVLDSGYSSYITRGMNHLKIIRQRSRIKAYVNGRLLSTVRDSSFLGSREVGLVALGGDTAPVHAYFDNFWVCPVDSAPGVGAAGAPGVGKGIILRRGTPPTIEFWPR